MKKTLILLSLLGTLVFVSCMEDNQTRNWREANEAFMNALADSSDIFPLEKADSLISVASGAVFEPLPKTGVYYKVLAQGTGCRPLVGETVNVKYTGTFYDGTVFDSGYSAFSLKNGSLIDGFFFALQRMTVGSHWVVYIPYYLGYGSTTYYYSTPTIPAYSALVFDIDLREIVK